MSSQEELTRSFSYPLRQMISLDDSDWEFEVPGLRRSHALAQTRLIKCISIITDMKVREHRMLLNLNSINETRAIRGLPLDKVMLLSVAGFRSFPPLSTSVHKLQPMTRNECTSYIIKFLRAGIVINGVQYNFYGHSNSQLKSRTCFLFAAPKEEISRMVDAFGDFSKMNTVAKKAKRIGLLFSDAHVAMTVSPERCEDIADIEANGYNFTDGCGLISPSLAQELARRRKIMHRDMRYTPSVFQLRYRGYKGVVTVDPTMRKAKTLLKFRKSMKKFSGGDDYSFSVVEYSKPYVFGNLNDETILLLHALGVPCSMILSKQEEHLKFLAEACVDPRAAFRFLSYINKPELAEKVLIDSLESVKSRIRSLVNAEYSKMLTKRDEQRCRILIPKSRLLFGVSDAWGVLKEGECSVRITMDGDGQPRALKGTEIIVTRNPCLHPGDWQKLKVVERPELAHLVDCIVFATVGRRPSADMMSGGDLDGDTFFVCWDPDLIPSTVAQPALYPGVREPLSFKAITDDDRLVYFAKYSNASLGRVKNLYLDWAKVTGPMSAECQELNRLFSQCVDGNKIKIPPKLEKVPPLPEDAEPFILDELHSAAEEMIRHNRRLINGKVKYDSVEGYDFDAMELLVTRDVVAMSEFELIKLTQTWCKKNEASLENFLHCFDLGVLSADEKAWVLGHVPAEAANLVTNALCSSNLVDVAELMQFKLHYPGLRWKCVYDSSSDRLGTFLDYATKYLEIFHRKLIVFRPDERLTLAIYVPSKIEKSKDCQIDNHVRVFAFPHSKGRETSSRLALPTKTNYRLYCDDHNFQLFESHRRNTWIYLARGPADDSSYRNIDNVGDRRRRRQETLDNGVNFDYRASVALDKFSKNLQRHIGRINRNGVSAAEIYVISNRDANSMLSLDLWLQYIDTGETLPLFDQKAKDYTMPSISDMGWLQESQHLCHIVRMQDFDALKDLTSPKEYSMLFDWLLERDQRKMLLQSFDFLLQRFHLGGPALVEPTAVLKTMLDTLGRAPYLAISFSRGPPWSEFSNELADMLEESTVDILRAFILSVVRVEDLVVAPLQSFLSRVRMLSLSDYARIVELLALTVRSPELALDILLQCFEPQSVRMLTARPKIIQYLVRNLAGITLDHIDEIANQNKVRPELLELTLLAERLDGYEMVEISFRVDSPGGTPETSAHVRLVAASVPTNVALAETYSIDAMVKESQRGSAKLQCFHPLPPFFRQCSWKIQDCGPFVTTKTMMDAVRTFVTQEESCGISQQILTLPLTDSSRKSHPPHVAYETRSNLNLSQKDAVHAALKHSVTCLWGPPGTGKTETIVEMIRALEESFRDKRILVTAPTHNAVDNVMRRYLEQSKTTKQREQIDTHVLRVSTEVRKVAEDLRKHTCDGMAGHEIYHSHKAMNEAKARIKKCRIVFTTCIGAGLGLLRSQNFDVVIIDEASQQTEAASLVPLTKGCQKAILVGDHVQLRPTVQQNALLLDYDVSLFERLYKEHAQPPSSTHSFTSTQANDSVARLMLDTQYRMHETICSFISREFYEEKLHTGISKDVRPLPRSTFPWPLSASGDHERMIFIECSGREESGNKSKSNRAQAELCMRVLKSLCTEMSSGAKEAGLAVAQQSIAVLTPYARQAELLKKMIPSSLGSIDVSSIDGFQGREADIVIFVTVRCNQHCEIGFLRDLRRLNVALTRCRTGLILIGHRATLSNGTADPESTQMLKRLLDQMVEIKFEEEDIVDQAGS